MQTFTYLILQNTDYLMTGFKGAMEANNKLDALIKIKLLLESRSYPGIEISVEDNCVYFAAYAFIDDFNTDQSATLYPPASVLGQTDIPWNCCRTHYLSPVPAADFNFTTF